MRNGLSPNDTLSIFVTSGPFTGYTNFGTVQNGSIVSFPQVVVPSQP